MKKKILIVNIFLILLLISNLPVSNDNNENIEPVIKEEDIINEEDLEIEENDF